jgi:predicted Zn-dependent protease
MALGWDEEARVEAAEVLRINPNFSLGEVGIASQADLLKEQERFERFFDTLREWAIRGLKRTLTHNPDSLAAHILLARLYGVLGWEEEARQAAAEILRINPHFSLEVVRQTVPFKDQERLERLLDGLRKAGLK